jgi:hypothetical protein
MEKSIVGTIEERNAETKTALIVFKHNLKPEIIFTGFWSGRLIHSAQNALSKAYRLSKYRISRPDTKVVSEEIPVELKPVEVVKENGDVRPSTK